MGIIFLIVFIGFMIWMHKKGIGCCGGHNHSHDTKQNHSGSKSCCSNKNNKHDSVSKKEDIIDAEVVDKKIS